MIPHMAGPVVIMRLSLRTLSLAGCLAFSGAFLQPVPSQKATNLAKRTVTAEADRAPAIQVRLYMYIPFEYPIEAL